MQHVVRGRGSLTGANIAALLEALSVQKPLLVCGSRMAAVFRERTGMDWPVFSGYHPNPDLADSTAGADMYRACGCDGLISLGGGSAMDTAKAVKELLQTGDMVRVKRSDLPEGVGLPHIAIPGTAGTGSEATPFAVVYVDGQKLSLDHPQLLPEAVVLDSTLLATLPEYHKKSCAMDALCQGIESWWAKGATVESRMHALRAVRGVLTDYTAYVAGDADAADGLLEAAYESGLAIAVSRTTAAHAMSYQLTKQLGYAHGHACMLTLPWLWQIAEEEAETAAVQRMLTEALGLPEPGALAVPLLGMLAESGMTADKPVDVLQAVRMAEQVNVQRLGNHPQALTQEKLRAVYTVALKPMDGDEKRKYAEQWRQADRERPWAQSGSSVR